MDNQEITIKMTVEKWNVVMQALGNMPFVQVNNIIAELKSQADSQLNSTVVSQTITE